ncbi:MAG: hypothetical protein ABIR32_03050 [Ilumatobacteraceae bacterium]
MMGFFKDYRTLSKQTRAMSARTDVGGNLATMQAKMEALNNSMSKAATGRAMLQGFGCRASVVSAQPTGASVNGGQVIALHLLVLMAGRPPITVHTTEIVPAMCLPRAVPGSSIPVRIMLDDPTDIHIDWTEA